MSAAASWANTAKATHWARLGRDDWTGAQGWAAPVVFACDYGAKSVPMTDVGGQAFISRQQLYTEYPSVNGGDMVLLGEHTNPDPVAESAWLVRSVTRWGDTFDRVADDYLVAS